MKLKNDSLRGILAEFKYFLNSNNAIIGDVLNKYNLSQNEYMIFHHISYTPGITQYELAKKLKFTTQRLNQLSKGLVNEGYIDKVERDGALLKKGLYVTPKGEETIETVNREINIIMSDLLNPEEIEDLEIINKLLKRINKKIRKRVK